MTNADELFFAPGRKFDAVIDRIVRDAARYRCIKKNPPLQGSLNGYKTFEEAVDARMIAETIEFAESKKRKRRAAPTVARVKYK